MAPRLLLLDEAGSGMSVDDLATLAALLRRLTEEEGSTSAGAGTTQAHPGTPGTAGTLASVMVTPAQQAIILVISSALESLLLVVVARNYIRSRRRVAAPVETTDLP